MNAAIQCQHVVNSMNAVPRQPVRDILIPKGLYECAHIFPQPTNTISSVANSNKKFLLELATPDIVLVDCGNMCAHSMEVIGVPFCWTPSEDLL